MNKKIIILLTGIALLTIAALFLFQNVKRLEVKTDARTNIIYIPTGSDYYHARDIVVTGLGLEAEVFDWLARRKNYDNMIHPGRYEINDGDSYLEVIDMLRAGKQKPVKVTFNNVRTIDQLAGKVGGRIETDSISIISYLQDDSNYAGDGFSRETIIGVFIPNTYELYWNTSAEGFYKRMLREYKSFWNEERLKQAADLGLTENEVSILASIVDEEVAKSDEKPRIAGVYLNRIRIGMPLQADPTIRFALNDFTISRVLNKHLVIDSPYNTYKYKGLPPGPVACPSIEGIEAVLNAEKHNYLYFVAKADFSGYHNFSRSLAEHNRYANLYKRELDRRRIFK